MHQKQFLSVLLFLSGTMVLVESQLIRGGFTINDNQYTLRWEVHHPFITFRAIARGTGFVGFGLSPKGTMEAADIFISGMYDNGTVYAIVSLFYSCQTSNTYLR